MEVEISCSCDMAEFLVIAVFQSGYARVTTAARRNQVLRGKQVGVFFFCVCRFGTACQPSRRPNHPNTLVFFQY